MLTLTILPSHMHEQVYAGPKCSKAQLEWKDAVSRNQERKKRLNTN